MARKIRRARKSGTTPEQTRELERAQQREDDLRREALRLAACPPSLVGNEVVADAEVYLKFLLGGQ